MLNQERPRCVTEKVGKGGAKGRLNGGRQHRVSLIHCMPRIYQKRPYQQTFHSSSFEILEAPCSRRCAYSRSHKSRTHSTRLWDREVYMLCIRDRKVNIFTFLSIRYVHRVPQRYMFSCNVGFSHKNPFGMNLFRPKI